jgi:hypothetical protein
LVKKLIKQSVSFVGETVEAIAEDPLPFIATIALTAAGVPPPLASAAVTAARGGEYGRYCYCGRSQPMLEVKLVKRRVLVLQVREHLPQLPNIAASAAGASCCVL